MRNVCKRWYLGIRKTQTPLLSGKIPSLNWVVAVLGISMMGINGPVAAARSASIEDVLKIEAMGAAKFSPNGMWLAYNLVPPYAELEDYSYSLNAYGQSGHQVWIKSLSETSAPFLQPGLDPGRTNFIIEFSPDSRHVLVLEYTYGQYRIVACYVGVDDCVRFSPLPDFKDMYVSPAPWNQKLVWISDSSFVLPTRPRDRPGSELRNRAGIARYLWENWNAAWSGSTVTALEVRSEGTADNAWDEGALMLFNLDSGATTSIVDGRFAGPVASPRGSAIAAARVGERRRPDPHASMTPNETHPMYDRLYALRLIEVETGGERIIQDPYNVDPDSLVWSRDGRFVGGFGWGRRGGPKDGRFFRLDVNSLEVVHYNHFNLELANNRVDPDFFMEVGPARVALMKSGMLVFARGATATEFGWYLLAENGDVNALTEGISKLTGEVLFADDRNAIVLSGQGVLKIGLGQAPVFITDLDQENLAVLRYRSNRAHSWSPAFRFDSASIRRPFGTKGVLVVSDQASAADRQVIFANYGAEAPTLSEFEIDLEGAKVLAASEIAQAALVSQRKGAGTRLVLIAPDQVPTELAVLNSHLNAVEHPKTVPLQYELIDPEKEANARRVEGCLILPAGTKEGANLPLILELYPTERGGSCDTLGNYAVPAPFQKDLWASHGFAYFFPAMPSELVRTDEGPIAGMDELVAQTLSALKETGYIDPERTFLFGVSQGGVAALYVASRAGRVAGTISINGWADFLSHYFQGRGLMKYLHLDQNGGDNRWRYDCLSEGPESYCPFGFGASALDEPTLYVENSPVTLARNITAPVMLVHSDLDYFDSSQYDEMFGALYRAGKQARYIRYWGEGHAPSSPANIRDLWERIEQFLESAEKDRIGRDK